MFMRNELHGMKMVFLAASVFAAASLPAAGGAVGPGPVVPIGPGGTTSSPSIFLGLTWTFGGLGGGGSGLGGTPGISLKVLSTNERNAGALSAGVTYNFDGSFGCDIGVGLNGADATVTLGFDFCKRGIQLGVGATTTKPVAAPPVVLMAPPPV